ncbi:MAG: cobalamin-dependent protein, partial [Sphingomonadales bacterium]
MAQSEVSKIRIVTAASLFDGHDAAINIMRRILQQQGAEIIHLGHNRSVKEIVETAIEEDVQGIAITSYQGGHVEFFKYMKDLLVQNGCGHIKIVGGGGGTILPEEIDELHAYGIDRIFSPDDGRRLGLEGMIAAVIDICQQTQIGSLADCPIDPLGEHRPVIHIARAISVAEKGGSYQSLLNEQRFAEAIASVSKKVSSTPSQEDTGTEIKESSVAPVFGITGTGGAGKSSVTDEIVRRYLNNFTDKTIAVISVDPSRKKTGGALLGDRIRMNAINHPRAYMRSLATRDDNTALSAALR